MSPYLIVYLLLLFFAAVCVICQREFPALFLIAFVVLTLFIVLRYGQGTDYLNYRYLYYKCPQSLSLPGIIATSAAISTEPGWCALSCLFRTLGASFPLFSGVLSLVEMLLLGSFVWRFCKYRCLCLLLLYPTVYLTYMFSALRQGLVFAVFFGVLVPLLVKKKYILFAVLTAPLILLHYSAAILLLAPFLIMPDVRGWCWITGAAAVAGVFMSSQPGLNLTRSVLTAFNATSYGADVGTNWLAIGERLVMLILVLLIYRLYVRRVGKEDRDPVIEPAIRLYCAGMCLFLLFCWLPLMSSRISFPFKAFEIVLIPTMLWRMPKCRLVVCTFTVALTMLMTVKNLDSYIEQGAYNAGIGALNYPYVSVFDSKDIFELRTVQKPYILKDLP